MSAAPRRVRLDLAYDGTDFEGWQFQPRGRTVQGTVEAVLTRIQANRPVRLRAAGRTDSGAHARQQVADFRIATDLDDGALEHALHRMLPEDVRPVALCSVAERFHSQRDARRKTYRYFLDLSRFGDPRRSRYAWRPGFRFDRDTLEEALSRLPGRKDWSAFAGARCRVEDRVRHLMRAGYEQPDPELGCLVFGADGFLTYMVRNLVGSLLQVARGRLPANAVDEIVASRDPDRCGPTVPARGLCLWEVAYDLETAAPPEDEAARPVYAGRAPRSRSRRNIP